MTNAVRLEHKGYDIYDVFKDDACIGCVTLSESGQGWNGCYYMPDKPVRIFSFRTKHIAANRIAAIHSLISVSKVHK